MKKKISVLLVVAVFALSGTVIAFASESGITAETLAATYYEPVAMSRSASTALSGDSTDLLNGSTIDYQKIVSVYSPDYDVSLETGYNAFVSALESGQKLSDIVAPSGNYMTIVSGKSDPVPGTAFMVRDGQSFSIQAISEADRGQLFVLSIGNQALATLQENLDASSLNVDHVSIVGIGHAVLFHDGANEYILFNDVVEGTALAKGEVYTTAQLLQAVKGGKDTIVLPIHELTTDENGNIDYVVG